MALTKEEAEIYKKHFGKYPRGYAVESPTQQYSRLRAEAGLRRVSGEPLSREDSTLLNIKPEKPETNLDRLKKQNDYQAAILKQQEMAAEERRRKGEASSSDSLTLKIKPEKIKPVKQISSLDMAIKIGGEIQKLNQLLDNLQRERVYDADGNPVYENEETKEQRVKYSKQDEFLARSYKRKIEALQDSLAKSEGVSSQYPTGVTKKMQELISKKKEGTVEDYIYNPQTRKVEKAK